MAIDPAKTDGQLAVAADDPTLAEITRRLVETYRPERIYLFGSRARGTAGADSDDDLLVVVRDDVPPGLRRSARAYQALWGLPTSGDLLIWNPHSLRGASAPPCVLAVHGGARTGGHGFDAARGQFVDLVEAGIIDSTKVVRSALENAVSVADVLLLAEGTLTEIEEKDSERGPGVPEMA